MFIILPVYLNKILFTQSVIDAWFTFDGATMKSNLPLDV